MAETNFMLQDIRSTLLGCSLFPLVLIMPGYVVGWALNLFDFRARLVHSRLALSLLLSVAISPVLFYLLASFLSFSATFLVTALFFMAFVVLVIVDRPAFPLFHNKAMKWVFICAILWIAIALFLLVDIQIGRELFFSVVSYDQTTRISIVDAMSRTGVPPVNPSYYPGYPVQMNFLYFFWYILSRMVDQIGGSQVDARGAFFASTIWCGIALMCTIAFYLRMRISKNSMNIWALALIGISLLTVSGLDFLPVSFAMRYAGGVVSDIEHWNEQITGWFGSLLWVPHHVAAMIACLVGVMLALSMRGQTIKRQYILMVVAGIAFASAFGLSVWVTFVFVLFWGVWIVIHFVGQKDINLVLPMIFAGIVALALSVTFLLGIFSSVGAGGSSTGFPITFEVRAFSIADQILLSSSRTVHSILRLILLPFNYFLELGFYFLIGILWLRQKYKEAKDNPLYAMEMILFWVAFFVGTFMRSTVIENNDLGWRAWLPAQFILLIWGVDIFSQFLPFTIPRVDLSGRTKLNLLILAVLGISKKFLDFSLLRSSYYLALGHEVGNRIYSARQAYAVINQTLPEDVVVQYNPASTINRPIGLYGMRQSAISDRTAYGIPTDIYLAKATAVQRIFNLQNISDWLMVDNLCREHFIDVLVIVDGDKLWDSLNVLKLARPPLYMDKYFAVFTCGTYATSQVP